MELGRWSRVLNMGPGQQVPLLEIQQLKLGVTTLYLHSVNNSGSYSLPGTWDAEITWWVNELEMRAVVTVQTAVRISLLATGVRVGASMHNPYNNRNGTRVSAIITRPPMWVPSSEYIYHQNDMTLVAPAGDPTGSVLIVVPHFATHVALSVYGSPASAASFTLRDNGGTASANYPANTLPESGVMLGNAASVEVFGPDQMRFHLLWRLGALG